MGAGVGPSSEWFPGEDTDLVLFVQQEEQIFLSIWLVSGIVANF